jgi:hypothetical protein
VKERLERGGGGEPSFGFDRVEIPNDEGEPERLSKCEFEALPLQERVGLLVQGTLRFYRGDQPVTASNAMRSAY